ncbi:MAG TPA: LexA family transcriptional regulator [Candidatus Manganitrophaceae bacterium]
MKKIAKATDINKRIKQARERAGLTQKEFSARIGISRSFLSEIEAGKVKPSIEALIGLLRNFDIDAHWLLMGAARSKAADLLAAEAPSEYRPSRERSADSPALPLLSDETVSGPPHPVSEKDIAGYIPVWDLSSRKRGYCFYTRDDGMAPLIRRGALVGVVPFSGRSEKLNGALAAAWLPKEGLMVRRFRVDQKHIILEPENKAYAPLYLEKSDRMALFSVAWWRQHQIAAPPHRD